MIVLLVIIIAVVVWLLLLPFQKYLTFWTQAAIVSVVSIVMAFVIISIINANVGQ